MIECKIKPPHVNLHETVIEMWDGETFLGTIYPKKDEVRIVSRSMKDSIFTAGQAGLPAICTLTFEVRSNN